MQQTSQKSIAAAGSSVGAQDPTAAVAFVPALPRTAAAAAR